ncbi:MAG: carbonate dehydratase [Burkholderiaceae bacterium]
MSQSLDRLLHNNRDWARAEAERDPDFFRKLIDQQAPEYLWIGCSDSRVPANQITGLAPGEVFVHRNIANLVVHTDLNCLTVIDFAVDLLKVKHVMVVGHHGCSGVRMAMQRTAVGLSENWLRHIQDVERSHSALLATAASDDERVQMLCELNVVEQAANVCETSVVQNAWKRGAEISVHGWIYSLADGLLVDLGFAAANAEDAAATRARALEGIERRHRERQTRAS